MFKAVSLSMAIGLAALALAGGKPLASVSKFDGKFMWVKLNGLPAADLKSLSKGSNILIDVSFPKSVSVKKDARGNQWFTFILADQGSDWKWHQTTGSAAVPVVGGTIKAGSYTITLPIGGIPKTVLSDKMQTISLGPATSGLTGTAAFSITRVRGK